MTSFAHRRIAVFGAAFLALGLAGCTPDKPQFKSIDITGADYAKDFRLADHHGQERTVADFKGKAVVVFFGFTQCPDVCPTTLAEMAELKKQLGADGGRLQVLFVTVDPERDTQEVLAGFVPAFDPSFVGLRGNAEQTAQIAKDFKIFVQKVAAKDGQSYSIDHTAGSYLFDPQGKLRLFVRHGQREGLLNDIRQLMAGA